tara:strand:+ start:504 stop:725 length:222 start_codon:yes stop_codon:yes gene_type:complete
MKNSYSSFNNLESTNRNQNYLNRDQSLSYTEKVDINKILNRVKLNKKNEKKNKLLKCCMAVLLVVFTIIITRF